MSVGHAQHLDSADLGSTFGPRGLQEEGKVVRALHLLRLDPHSSLCRDEAKPTRLAGLNCEEGPILVGELPDRQDRLPHWTNEEGHSELDVRLIVGLQLELHRPGHRTMLDLDTLGISQARSLGQRFSRDPGRKGLWAHVLIGP